MESENLNLLRLQDLEKRNEQAMRGGGEARLAKQKQGGRLTARERLYVLLDPGSFVVMDRFVSHRCTIFGMGDQVMPGDGITTGYGHVNGKLVYVSSQDFTVIGG